MKSLNKYEVSGIIGSIIVMIVVLGAIRPEIFDGVRSAVADKYGALTSKAPQDAQTENDATLEEILFDAHSMKGELVKLVIEDVRDGEAGEPVEEGDTLTVHYVGQTIDGTTFDSSYERNKPYVFTLGNGTVIQGWEEGLIGMKVGGKRILVVPSDMAYGNSHVGIIPPNSTLVYAIELITVK